MKTENVFILSDEDLYKYLSGMEFTLLGQGASAYVFSNTEETIVLKIFPPLNVGTSEEFVFIRKNPLLRFADIMSVRWQHVSVVKWLRQKVKFILAIYQSSRNSEKRETSSEMCIRGYERCIDKGLMSGLPTRVIPNFSERLPIKTTRMLRGYLKQPKKMVMQKRFSSDDLLLNVLKRYAVHGDSHLCDHLIDKAIRYNLNMWKLGLVSTDMSFNVFENLIVLPDGCVQLHDANDVVDSFSPALWFVREKEKDLHEITLKMRDGHYPDLLFETSHGSIAESARKLYNTLPHEMRDELVISFLDFSRQILSEDVLKECWKESHL